jgi:CDGSH-type Zn-finger protein
MFTVQFLLSMTVLLVVSTRFANALITSSSRWLRTSTLSVSTDSIPTGEKINKMIDLDSPKVVNNIELKAGEKCVVCRCWKSSKHPLCDGSHVKWNKETGDNVGMLMQILFISFNKLQSHRLDRYLYYRCMMYFLVFSVT